MDIVKKTNQLYTSAIVLILLSLIGFIIFSNIESTGYYPYYSNLILFAWGIFYFILARGLLRKKKWATNEKNLKMLEKRSIMIFFGILIIERLVNFAKYDLFSLIFSIVILIALYKMVDKYYLNRESTIRKRIMLKNMKPNGLRVPGGVRFISGLSFGLGVISIVIAFGFAMNSQAWTYGVRGAILWITSLLSFGLFNMMVGLGLERGKRWSRYVEIVALFILTLWNIKIFRGYFLQEWVLLLFYAVPVLIALLYLLFNKRVRNVFRKDAKLDLLNIRF